MNARPMSNITHILARAIDTSTAKHQVQARGDIRYLHRGKLHPDGPARIETVCDPSKPVTLHAVHAVLRPLRSASLSVLLLTGKTWI
jgi:hypothetical protein